MKKSTQYIELEFCLQLLAEKDFAMSLTMAKIKRLDDISKRETNRFAQLGQAYTGPLPFFKSEKRINIKALRSIVEQWKVTTIEFILYVSVQKYIDIFAKEGCGPNLLSPAEVARDIKLPPEEVDEFCKYVFQKRDEIRQSLQNSGDDYSHGWHDIVAEDLGEIHDAIAEAVEPEQ